MLTQLKFKNWRSLKDETIDFTTPITVFIGANSSGKTNILDALYFLRYVLKEDDKQAIYNWGGSRRIRNLHAGEDQPVNLEFSYLSSDGVLYTQRTEIKFTINFIPSGNDRFPVEFPQFSSRIVNNKPICNPDNPANEIEALQEYHDTFVQKRWQMLDENFIPPLSIPFGNNPDLYLIERTANNFPAMLNFMQQTRPDLYEELMFDFRWLLGHVESGSVNRDDRETRLLLTEKSAPEREAPSVSAGTARLLAMLTAYYALDMRYAEMPGLVVIEEPDTALNPWIVEKFVEQLRSYVDREHHPRQFILTTHNPHMLDFFEPEEVRIVERDEQGYTTVKRIPEHIKEIWLKDGEYSLGEVWLTNSFGGMPE